MAGNIELLSKTENFTIGTNSNLREILANVVKIGTDTSNVTLSIPQDINSSYNLILPVRQGASGESLVYNKDGQLIWRDPTVLKQVISVYGPNLTGNLSSTGIQDSPTYLDNYQASIYPKSQNSKIFVQFKVNYHASLSQSNQISFYIKKTDTNGNTIATFSESLFGPYNGVGGFTGQYISNLVDQASSTEQITYQLGYKIKGNVLYSDILGILGYDTSYNNTIVLQEFEGSGSNATSVWIKGSDSNGLYYNEGTVHIGSTKNALDSQNTQGVALELSGNLVGTNAIFSGNIYTDNIISEASNGLTIKATGNNGNIILESSGTGSIQFNGALELSNGNIIAQGFIGDLSGNVNAKIISATTTTTNEIIEYTSNSGVTIESVLIKDGNVTGNLTGNVSGNVTGNLTGNVTGNVTGDITGNVTGNVTGDITGNVSGNLTGNVTGNLTGIVTGDVTGDVTGNLTGNVTGDVTGNVTGNLTGNVTGDVTGDVSGNLTGNVTGNLTGIVTGDVTGNLTGNVTGNLTGDVTGNLTGIVTGDVTGNLTGDVTGTVSSLSNHTTDNLTEGSNKYYADSFVDSHLSGGTGVTYSSGSISIGQSVGTSDNVRFNNVTVDGTLNSDDITGSNVNVSNDLVVSGNLTVNGTQTIVKSTILDIGDNKIVVNASGSTTDAGITANINGVEYDFVYSTINNAWGTTGNIRASAFIGDGSQLTGINEDQTVSLTGNGATTVSGTYPNFTISSTDTNTDTTYTAGTGLQLSGTEFINTAPDQTVSLTGNGATTVSGTYPNFTISSTDTNTDTTYTAGTGLQLSGTEFINTAPDQTVSLTGNGAITVSGTYPIFTISSTDTDTTYTAGTGLQLSGTEFINTAPDQTVSLTGNGATTVSGTYPNFTISSTDTNTDTTYTAGTGLQLSGTEFINTAPDQTVSLTGNGAITVSGTYPIFTISSTDTDTTYTAGTGVTINSNEISIGQEVTTTSNVQFNNVTVNGTLHSDDITGSNVNVSNDLVVSGNLTVNGTQTIVNSTTLDIDDNKIVVNASGSTTDAGITANVNGVEYDFVYSTINNAWGTTGNIRASAFIGDGSQLTGINEDQTVSLTGNGATTVSGTYPNFTISSTDTNTDTTYTAGTGLQLSGTEFINTAPDQTVSLTGTGATTVSGTYPNFTISSTDTNTDTTYTAGTGLQLSGTEFINTAPDQTVSLTGTGATTVSGTYPNFTISSTDTNTDTTYTAGTGLQLSGTEFINTAPDQTVSLTGTGATTVSGTYPNFTISSTDTNTDTTYTAGTGLELSGTEFINSAPDQTVSLTGTGATTVSGTYPNFTISSTDTNTDTTYTAGTGVTINSNEISIGQEVTTTSNVQFNNVTVNGTLHSDDITGSNVNVSNDLVVSGNLTVNGTQTIVNSTTLDIDDNKIVVNASGSTTDAGITANVNGVEYDFVYSTNDNAWGTPGDLNIGGNVTAAKFILNGSQYILNTKNTVFFHADFGMQQLTASGSHPGAQPSTSGFQTFIFTHVNLTSNSSMYNVNTGEITPGVAGIYKITSVFWYWWTTNNGSEARHTININGVEKAWAERMHTDNNGELETLTVDTLLQLNETDKITVRYDVIPSTFYLLNGTSVNLTKVA